ncbi:MAG TPA: hypothetical protein VM324_02480, partial [Egibacteraceae bacterium]|nr:hypothetical protein [Egibacteraceae bacterium]
AGVAAACVGSLGIGCAPAIGLGLAGGAAIGAGTCDSGRSRKRCAAGGIVAVGGSALAAAALPAAPAVASVLGLTAGTARTLGYVATTTVGGTALEGGEQISSGHYDAGGLRDAAIRSAVTGGVLRGLGAVIGRLRTARTPTSGTTAPNTTGLVDDGVNVLPSSGKTFVGTPQGTVYDIPKGWASRPATSGKGIVFQRPGATGNADMIRIMEPTSKYPSGYVRYTNEYGQPLDVLGKPGAASATHIPQNYQGPWPGWPQ